MRRLGFAFGLMLSVAGTLGASAAQKGTRDLSYLKTKPYDQLTAAEITMAKEEAKRLEVRKLVICADPGNMPLSNNKKEGFQNKIAEAVGRQLGAEIEFFWRPYLERGITRQTFQNNECQILIDLPADYSNVLTTTPIYRSTYVLAYRSDSGLDIKSLDDPKLKEIRIGAFQHSAMRQALAKHGIKGDLALHIISVDSDLRPEAQPWRQVKRVVDREIDLAAVWGPFAGWVKKKGDPITVVPANFMDDEIPLEFSLAWGVQNTNVVLKLKIDMALEEAEEEIEEILRDYGVPLVACSDCIVQGDIKSAGQILLARKQKYEDRYLLTAKSGTQDDKLAAAHQVVTRERLEAWLEEGADLNAELSNAISGNDVERIKFLIEKGADVNAKDGLGHLPLHYAASQRKSEIMKVLVAAGADVNRRDSDNMTALLHAVNLNHVPSIKILTEAGADLEEGLTSGYTPLEMALGDGKFFAAKALIEAGSKVNVSHGSEALTPLMVAATQLQPKQRLRRLSQGPTPLAIAEELIKRGADINAKSKSGVTALMVAAGHNNAPLIGLLMRKGADGHAKSNRGMTALDIALDANNDAAAQALRFLVKKKNPEATQSN